MVGAPHSLSAHVVREIQRGGREGRRERGASGRFGEMETLEVVVVGGGGGIVNLEPGVGV